MAFAVMPGFMPGIHVFLHCVQDVDGRDKPGHDEAVMPAKAGIQYPQPKLSREVGGYWIPAFAGTTVE
jgi:hypothetical protein